MGLTLWLFPKKKLHCSLPTWFQMRIRLRGAVNLKGEGGRVVQQMHGIGGRRLVCKDVVEVRSNFKNSYFWWFGSDSTGSIRLFVWRKSRELGGRGSPRFPTSMMESFSTVLLPAIKSYWTESHLELFILLRLNPGAQREHLTRLLTTLRKYVERL